MSLHGSLQPLLLLLLLVTVQGIRLGPKSVTSTPPKIHEEERNSIEDTVVGEVAICRDGHCSGKSRMLVTSTTPAATATTTTTENGKSRATEAEPTPNSKQVGQNQEDLTVKTPTTVHQELNERYPDIVDIAGMDYSPARRKPPIHN